MNFLNPAFLISLAAVAIPLIVHFFSRRRVPRVRFSSLDFLRTSQRRSMKRINLRRILLLVLRMTAVALVALAFSRPVIRGAVVPGKAPAATCIILDRSYSMGLESGSGSLLERAKRVAAEVIRESGDNDRLILAAVDQNAEKVFETGGKGRGFALERLEKIEQSWKSTDLARGIKAGYRMLEQSGYQIRELYLISDFRAAGPGAVDGRLDEFEGMRAAETSLFMVPVTESSSHNLAILDIRRPESAIHKGEVVSIEVTILNGSAREPEVVPVSIFLEGERLINREVRLAPGQRKLEEFSFPADRTGWLRGEVSLGDDRLRYDNSRFFVIRVRERIDVLLAGDERFYLEKALNPGGPAGDIDLKVTGSRSMTSEDIRESDVVVLGSGPELWEEDRRILADYLESGGGAVVFVREGLMETAGMLSSFSPVVELRRREATLHDPGRVPDLLKPFGRDDIKKLSRLRFIIEPVMEGVPGRATVMRFKDGTPFIWQERRGQGKLLFILCLPEAAGGDLVLSPYFLPLVQQAVLSVAGSEGPESEALVGEKLRWKITGEKQARLLFEPEGREGAGAELSYRLEEDELVISALQRPGFITVEQGQEVAGRMSVNPDCALESNLRYINPEEFADSLGLPGPEVINEGEGISASIREARYGQEITGPVIMAAIAVFIIELLLAQSRAGSRRENVEQPEG
ncbi:MAG: BatA and WFA domain-containing protein [Candidatus Krumholzibacteriales bacterium]